jgi:hypothetical protein|tara:strand:+ start:557 stop:802 length:246 start_codon:yes stop_codon:yes gene_type:complete
MKEELVKMTEDLRQKEIRLKKELAKVKAINANSDAKVRKTRDLSLGGLPPDTSHKAIPSTASPDVVLLPPMKRKKKENIPF